MRLLSFQATELHLKTSVSRVNNLTIRIGKNIIILTWLTLGNDVRWSRKKRIQSIHTPHTLWTSRSACDNCEKNAQIKTFISRRLKPALQQGFHLWITELTAKDKLILHSLLLGFLTSLFFVFKPMSKYSFYSIALFNYTNRTIKLYCLFKLKIILGKKPTFHWHEWRLGTVGHKESPYCSPKHSPSSTTFWKKISYSSSKSFSFRIKITHFH